MERDDELPPLSEDKDTEPAEQSPKPGPRKPEDYEFEDWALI